MPQDLATDPLVTPIFLKVDLTTLAVYIQQLYKVELTGSLYLAVEAV